jgi:hypothetical protein
MTEKEHPDINSTLRNEGPEAVRERVNKAKRYKAKAKQNGGMDEAPPWPDDATTADEGVILNDFQAYMPMHS